ncbi:putative virion structural protein [Aeromonas phage Gekk3-15]
MQVIPISNLPNQTLAFTADGAYWELKIYQSVDYMCVDISINSELLICGFRCTEGMLLLPFDYLWDPEFGNLVFDSVPDWEKFGTECFLYYLDNAEANEWQTATQPLGVE